MRKPRANCALMTINPPYLLGHLPSSRSTRRRFTSHTWVNFNRQGEAKPIPKPSLPPRWRLRRVIPARGLAEGNAPGGGCAVPAGTASSRGTTGSRPAAPSPPELNTSRGSINRPSGAARRWEPGNQGRTQRRASPAPGPGQPPRPAAAPGENAVRAPAGWEPSFVSEQRHGGAKLGERGGEGGERLRERCHRRGRVSDPPARGGYLR